MRSIILLALLLAAGCYSSAWSQYKTPAGHQRAASRSLWPGDLEIPGAYHREKPIPYKVRLYVDQDYRRQRNWKANARQLVRWVNGYLVPAFGVGLVPELVEWERQGGGETLEGVLAELAAHDAAGDVDWVIGLTGAPPTASVSHHELGMAPLLGRHFVVRAYNNTAELEDLRQYFNLLEEDERIKLYESRRHHKEVVVFLHELAHSLGAVHERGDGRIMGPAWAPEACTFSEPGAAVLEIGLRLRRIRGTDAEADAARKKLHAEMLALYATENDEWWADDRELMVATLGGGSQTRSVASEMSEARVPAAVRVSFERAQQAFASRAYGEAWQELEPLCEAYPRHLAIQGLGCRMAAHGVREAGKACTATAAIAPDDAWPLVVLATALGENDPAAAVASLVDADRRLARVPDAELQAQVAQNLFALGAISHAEAAAARLGSGGVDLRERLLARRRLLGLAPGGKAVPVEREAEYSRLFDLALDAMSSGDALVARVPYEEARAQFPDAPGLAAIGCGIELSRGKAAAAQKLCAKAIAGWDDAMLAHFHMAQAVKDPKQKIHHWERVRALDPEQRSAWQNLFHLYRQTGRMDEHARVQAEYDKHFGRP